GIAEQARDGDAAGVGQGDGICDNAALSVSGALVVERKVAGNGKAADRIDGVCPTGQVDRAGDAAAALQGAGADRGVRGFGYATAGCRQIDRRAVQRSRVDGDAARAGCKCQGAGRTDEAVGGDGAAAAGEQGDVGGGNRAVDREVAGIGQVEISGRNDEAGQFGHGV